MGNTLKENCDRILDDCYISLDATNIDPLQFFDILNNIHGNIKFTMTQQKRYLVFTNTMINKDPETNIIWMEIF